MQAAVKTGPVVGVVGVNMKVIAFATDALFISCGPFLIFLALTIRRLGVT